MKWKAYIEITKFCVNNNNQQPLDLEQFQISKFTEANYS